VKNLGEKAEMCETFFEKLHLYSREEKL